MDKRISLTEEMNSQKYEIGLRVFQGDQIFFKFFCSFFYFTSTMRVPSIKGIQEVYQKINQPLLYKFNCRYTLKGNFR